MPLIKKIIALSIFFSLLICFLSGCMFLGTNFTLNSSKIYDDNGFPSIFINFTSSGTVYLKLYNPNSVLIDSDFFFSGTHEAIIHIGEYRQTVLTGNYELKIFDKDSNLIKTETFSFNSRDISILTCEQKWWKREISSWGSSLFGLKFEIINNGNIPVYPELLKVTIDTEEISEPITPKVIMPQTSENIDCFIYKKIQPEASSFSIDIFDNDNLILLSGTYLVDIVNNVETKKFIWDYNKINRQINLPIPDGLYDYYLGLNRTLTEDYALYVFDKFDDTFINIIIETLMKGFSSTKDVDIINYLASFVQNLQYKDDPDGEEYPRYPIETLFYGNGGGDCEDKSILMASFLEQEGYNVTLLRLPEHMAVGVNLNENAVPGYEYYVDEYYYLETTTEVKPLGYVPSNYRSVYPTLHKIDERPILVHNWNNGLLTIYTKTDLGDLVKVIIYIKNLGSGTAENIVVNAAFYSNKDIQYNSKSENIITLDSGKEKKIILSCDIPKGVITWFKTRIYYNGIVVDERESVDSFPT